MLIAIFVLSSCSLLGLEEDEAVTNEFSVVDNATSAPTDDGLCVDRIPGVEDFWVSSCSFYSSWESVAEMPGISYRLRCEYQKVVHTISAPIGKSYCRNPLNIAYRLGGPWEICFYLEVENSTNDQYISRDFHFGIPIDADTSIVYATDSKFDRVIAPNSSMRLQGYGHRSREPSDTRHRGCEESYSGKVNFFYVDKYGNKTGDTVVEKHLNSTTLKLDLTTAYRGNYSP